jgi:hypothetical protein
MGRKTQPNATMGCIIIAKENSLLGDVLTESEYNAVSLRFNKQGEAIATLKEVADAMSIPQGSIQVLLARARLKFQKSNIQVASIPGAVRTVMEKQKIIIPEKSFHISQVPSTPRPMPTVSGMPVPQPKPVEVPQQSPMIIKKGIDFGIDELLKKADKKQDEDTVWTSDLGLAAALVYHKFKMTQMRVNGIAKKATFGFENQPGVKKFQQEYLDDNVSVNAKTFIIIRERIKGYVYNESDGFSPMKVIGA